MTGPFPDRPDLGHWRLPLAGEADTVALAGFVAGLVKPGDVIALSGDLGAGKTTFARAFIRQAAGDPDLDVPSPTFTLIQTYDTPRGALVHADFYRLRSADELAELGWDEAVSGALVLVEWPERAAEALPPDRLEIAFALGPDARASGRVATLIGHGAWAQTIAIARAVRGVLDSAGWSAATRAHVQGDASTRAYERLTRGDGRSAILMIAPRRPDGPPVRRGRPYSAIAKLAESVHPFVAMANGLINAGLSAPEIYAADLEAGVLLIEDFGAEPVIDANGPIEARYEAATDALAHLHARELPDTIPLAGAETYTLPPYDMEALTIETDLLIEWYAPHIARATLTGAAQAQFGSLWTMALDEIVAGPKTWTLRDYHSPNLIWLPGREGVRRVGLLDFQDAVIGHPAYDVVSLLQDARVTVPPDMELRLLGAYARARRAADPGFDMAAFARAYAILGAQRATKIVGIFARLDKRDGKPAYLRHLPRVEAYLRRNLAHPALTAVKAWYETQLPGFAPGG